MFRTFLLLASWGTVSVAPHYHHHQHRHFDGQPDAIGDLSAPCGGPQDTRGGVQAPCDDSQASCGSPQAPFGFPPPPFGFPPIRFNFPPVPFNFPPVPLNLPQVPFNGRFSPSTQEFFGGNTFNTNGFRVQQSTIHSSEGIEDNQYKVIVSLTGYQKNDITINVNDRVLMIQATHIGAGYTQYYNDMKTLPSNVDVNFSWTYDGQILCIVFPLKVLPKTEPPVVEQITEQIMESITQQSAEQVTEHITETPVTQGFEFNQEVMNSREFEEKIEQTVH